MYPLMGGGNVNMWHDRMYVHCTLVATQLLIQCHIYNNSKISATCKYNASFEKSNTFDYICIYDIYKLLYKRSIFNSLATIIQLTNFLKIDNLFINTLYFHGDSCIVVVIPRVNYKIIVYEFFFEFSCKIVWF